MCIDTRLAIRALLQKHESVSAVMKSTGCKPFRCGGNAIKLFCIIEASTAAKLIPMPMEKREKKVANTKAINLS